MVALQILVLTVGVRILLGELKLNRLRFSFFYAFVGSSPAMAFYGSFEYRFSSSPSQGGETGSTPVGAKKSFRITVQFIVNSLFGEFFFRTSEIIILFR